MRPRKSHRNDPGNPRGGNFEVRVIGERPAPAPVAGEGGAVEIGLRIGGGNAAEVFPEAAEPVARLEAEAPAELPRARPHGEAGPAVPYQPRQRKKKRSLATWTLWMAAGSCVLAVAAVAAAMAAREKAPEAPGETAVVFAAEDDFGAEQAYFLEHSVALTREAEALLARYAAARTVAEVLPLVREPQRVADALEKHWEPLGGLSPTSPVESAVMEGLARPALMLTATTADYSRCELVFVRDDGRLKLDWEASRGIGDVTLDELRSGKNVVKGARVRVHIQPGNFFTPEFPEEAFRSYQLLDAAREQFVWAFARRGSAVAAALEAELNQDSVLFEKASGFRGTLRISGPLSARVNLFEITEMLHKGWVKP